MCRGNVLGMKGKHGCLNAAVMQQTIGWKIACMSQDIPVDKEAGGWKLKHKSQEVGDYLYIYIYIAVWKDSALPNDAEYYCKTQAEVWLEKEYTAVTTSMAYCHWFYDDNDDIKYDSNFNKRLAVQIKYWTTMNVLRLKANQRKTKQNNNPLLRMKALQFGIQWFNNIQHAILIISHNNP